MHIVCEKIGLANRIARIGGMMLVTLSAWVTRPAGQRLLLLQHGLQVGEQLQRLRLLEQISRSGQTAALTAEKMRKR